MECITRFPNVTAGALQTMSQELAKYGATVVF
jgi:hypothetical protein